MGAGTFESFAGHMNETFRVTVGGSTVEMTLTEANKGKSREWAGVRKQPFNLIFKCPNLVILPQQSYAFENPGFGKMDIFIVPVARDRDGILYEAVFN